MNIQNILLGRAVRLLRFNQPVGGVHLKRAVEALRERYGFLSVPQTLEEYDETRGIHFKHGKFLIETKQMIREIVIDDFAVYSDGVVADTRSHTDDADAFLNDLIRWSSEHFQITIPSGQTVEPYYISNLEVVLETGLSKYVALSNTIAQQLTGSLNRYGLKRLGPFEVTSLTLDFDRKVFQSVSSGYTLQRKAGSYIEVR
jgi:hypothetical protein